MKVGIATAFLLASGCALFTRENARTALDVAHVVCIIAQAESDDATVARVCGVEQALYPEMRRILDEQRAAARRFAASKSAAPNLDAGPP